MSRLVECRDHRTQRAAFVCAHALESLRDGQPRGFFWTDADSDDPCGWCSDCNDRYEAAGGEWTGEAEAGLGAQLLCINCFKEIIKLNGFH